jgi:translocation and assembly module TamB
VKWLRRTLLGILALGGLAMAGLAAVVWLLGSQSGAEWLIARAETSAGNMLSVGSVEGSMLGGLVLNDVHVRLPRDEVDISTLRLLWNARAAIGGSLAFDTARASSVSYRRLPATAGASGDASAPALPFSIRVADGELESLTLRTEEDTLAFGPTRFSMRIDGSTLTFERVTSESGGVVLEGGGDIDLDRLHIAANLDWSALLAGQPANGHFRVDGDWPVLTLHHELAAPFRSVADGTLDVSGIPRVDLAIEWQGLVVPGVDRFASPTGRATIAGAIDGYRFDSAGGVVVDGRTADFTAAGEGRAGLISLSEFTFAPRGVGPQGELSAAGDVAIDTREWSLSLEALNLDPAWWLADWPGRITGRLRLRGRFAPELSASADDIDVRGELRGYALAATGNVAFDALAGWRFDGVHLASGPSRVDVDGRLGGVDGQELGLELTANVPDIAALWPDLEGSLTAKLTLGGAWRTPHGRGRIEARGLKVGAYRVASVVVSGQAGALPDAPLALDIDATDVGRGTLVAETVHAAFNGETADHRVAVTAAAADWSASLAAGGRLTETTWQGTVDDAQFDEHALGVWQLEAPARFEGGAKGLALGTSCFAHPAGGRWCAQLKVAGRPDDELVLTAQNFELQSLAPWLPTELKLQGVYQLAASLLDLTGNPHGALAITGGDTRAAIDFGGQPPFETELQDLQASATLDNGRLDLKGSVRRGADGRVDVGAAIEHLGVEDSPISGSVDVRWPDLGWFVLLAPDLGRVAGTLNVNLAVGGTLANPQVQGTAAWNDGQVGVPAWGLVVEGIEADAQTVDGNTLRFTATGKAGDGTLNLEGTTALDPERGWPTRLTLNGDSVRAVQLPDADILASPDLEVVAELPNLHVNGTVHVPHADIKLNELPEQAVTPSADTVVHGETARRVVKPLHLDGDILLTLGDDVHYSGLSLNTKVSGQLRLDVDSSRSANATGTLTLDGTYNAYGQELKLERGQLAFSGPLDDPGLDVRAVRTIEEVRVGVEMTGTIQNPRTRVFSTPSMSEADALSYLLLGRPVSGTGGQETATLQSAALSMGLQQALPVVQRIGQSLGLDEFTVQSTATDTGALMAGKYLSPKVYIRYTYGLFNRIGGVLLRFKVNERLSIETRSGEQKSMDLIYTVEKD